MNSRAVICLALLAMVGLSSATGTADAKAESDAQVQVHPKAVLSMPQLSVGLDIKKEHVPLMMVSEAPCKKVCKDKCTITSEKKCMTVTVPKKHCSVASKTITKQYCEKKCKPSLQLNFPQFHVPTKLSVEKQNPNPSTPPAHVATTDADNSMSVSVSKSVSVSAGAGKGNRKLQGLVAAALAKKAVQSMPELDLNCENVCTDIPVTVPDVSCKIVNEEVEQCSMVPSKHCEEECVCIPQKSLSFNMPKKPSVSFSVSKDGDH